MNLREILERGRNLLRHKDSVLKNTVIKHLSTENRNFKGRCDS